MAQRMFLHEVEVPKSPRGVPQFIRSIGIKFAEASQRRARLGKTLSSSGLFSPGELRSAGERESWKTAGKLFAQAHEKHPEHFLGGVDKAIDSLDVANEEGGELLQFHEAVKGILGGLAFSKKRELLDYVKRKAEESHLVAQNAQSVLDAYRRSKAQH